jgi:hypothetical protein
MYPAALSVLNCSVYRKRALKVSGRIPSELSVAEQCVLYETETWKREIK